MGAAVVERLLATRPVRAAALLAPVPPAGLLPMAARLAAEHPDYLLQMAQLDPARLSAHVLEALRPFYFSDDVDPAILAEAARHLGVESPRALLDLSLRLHWQLPERDGVAGARAGRRRRPHLHARRRARDRAPPRRRARRSCPGLAHMLMLEPAWERPARGARRLARRRWTDAAER